MASSDDSDSEPVASMGRGQHEQKKRKRPVNRNRTKKQTGKDTKKKPSGSTSESDDSPLAAVRKKPKSVDAVPSSSSDDDDDVPLRNFAENESGVTAKGTGKKNGHHSEEDSSDDDDKSDTTTGFEAGGMESDGGEETKAAKLSSKSTVDSGQTIDEQGSSAEGPVKKAVGADDSSSDTSVYNSDPGNKSTKEKTKRKRIEVKKVKSGGGEGGKGRKQKAESRSKADVDTEDPQLTKLKRCVREAGLRCVYKQLFDDCQSDKEKIIKLKQFFADKGLIGPITLESCKAFRSKREEQRELAELDSKNIISEGRSRRRNVRSLFLHDDGASADRKTTSESETSEDSEDEEAALEAQRECKEMFSRLKDIVDSGESD